LPLCGNSPSVAAAAVEKKPLLRLKPALWAGLDGYGSRCDRCGGKLGACTGCASALETENCSAALGGVGAAFGLGVVWPLPPFPLPLPRYARAARSEAERAGPEGQTFRHPPRKQVGSVNMRRQDIPVLPMLDAPGTGSQVCAAPATAAFAFAVNLTQQCQVDPPKRFSFGP